MKLLKILGIALLVMFIIMLAVSALAPLKMNIEETIVIQADSKTVFEQLNDFKNWPEWNAWVEKDKEIKWVFSEPSYGQGAFMQWESSRVGNGKQSIEVSEPNRHVITKLKFSGWEGDNYESFFIEQVPEGTKVTRSMDGAEFKFFMRGLGLLIRKMLKNDYKEGLKNLKALCEEQPKPLELKIERKIIKPIVGLGIMDTATSIEIGKKIGEDFEEIRLYMLGIHASQAGPPMAIYYQYKNDTMVFQAIVPSTKKHKQKENIKSFQLNGGEVVVGYYYGSFENIGQAHSAINKWIIDNKLQLNGAPWEVYVTDPNKEPDSKKWLTEVYYPIK